MFICVHKAHLIARFRFDFHYVYHLGTINQSDALICPIILTNQMRLICPIILTNQMRAKSVKGSGRESSQI
jgi:hypothetical protein